MLPELVSFIRCGELVVLRCRGELDLAAYGVLRAAVSRAEAATPEIVLVDLREVTFLDSAGCDALDDARRRIEEAGAWCGFADPAGEYVRVVLDLCDPHGHFRRWPTIAEALAAADARAEAPARLPT